MIKSPKSDAFPVVAMFTNSMTLEKASPPLTYPPPTTALVLDDALYFPFPFRFVKLPVSYTHLTLPTKA